MTVIDSRTPLSYHVLPTGVNGSLWSARPAYGVFDFRGSRLRIEVADSNEVLFPTDCGLSLLAALNGDDAPVLAGTRALDIGCGSGVYSVALLGEGAVHVTALDINPAAAAVATSNVMHNRLDPTRLTCVTSDLAEYTPAEKFDLVITNPPHLPYDPRYATDNGLEKALVAGHNGRALYDLVVDRIDDLLAPGGSLLMAHSSLTDIGRTVADLEKKGFMSRTLEVFEMDIPLLAYAAHKETMMGHLERLRDSGNATFEGERFTVHAMAFHRSEEMDDD
jgi:HemK-related putative methylase